MFVGYDPIPVRTGFTTEKMGALNFVTEKVLGIDVNERYSQQPDDLDKRAYEILEPADIYLEQEPTVGEFIRELAPTRDGVVHYMVSLFPSATWITRYKGAWLLGDVVAGRRYTLKTPHDLTADKI